MIGHRKHVRGAMTALCLGAAGAALTAGSPGAAQQAPVETAPGIQLDTRRCRASWAGGLARFVQIELGTDPMAVDTSALRVAVRCGGDLVDIDVAQRGDVNGTQRRMNLGATAASVRGRVVALAIAGLVRELALMADEPRATGTGGAQTDAAPARERAQTDAVEVDTPAPARERAQTDAAEVDTPAPADAAEADTPAPADAAEADRLAPADGAQVDASDPADAPDAMARSARDVQVDLLLLAGNFTASDDVVWGAGARAHLLGPSPWRPAFDVQAGTYARDTELGSAQLLSGSIAARLGFTLQGRGLALTPGLGQRLGLARASGTTDDPTAARARAVVAPWTASFAFVTFEASAFTRYRLGIDAELGIVQLPVHGLVARGDDVAVDGLWIALSAMFGVQL